MLKEFVCSLKVWPSPTDGRFARVISFSGFIVFCTSWWR